MMNNNPLEEELLMYSRRHFFGKMAKGVGAMALGGMVTKDLFAKEVAERKLKQVAPTAKNVIYLFQSGGPSQHDLFDHKPKLQELNGEDLRDHIQMTQRITGMSVGQSKFPFAGTVFDFKKHGESQAEISELLPHIAGIADEICIVKNMYTEAINHDPAITFFQTGSEIPGRPSMGSWMSYGLGSLNENLPTFVSMVSRGSGRPNCQPLYDRLWGSGFLPTQYSGVKFMPTGDPVLYLKNPEGLRPSLRKKMLDQVNLMNEAKLKEFGDPEIFTRIKQYELAYKMQTSVPELSDLSDEPQHILDMYGPDVHRRGSYAFNCIMARRLVERGVRFTQLYHMGWDQHATLPKDIVGQCKDIDQPSAALIKDLKQRGLLDDTLVIWGGEFGRTAYSQGALTKTNYGRDHHPKCFTKWLAGGGIKPGMTYGQTDDFGYGIVDADGNPVNPDKHHYTPDAVHVHDLQATIMHIMGIDHTQLTYQHQGRDFRLTDVHGKVVKGILS